MLEQAPSHRSPRCDEGHRTEYSHGVNGGGLTTNATYCATVVDQLIVEGLTHAFIAPGSRSTPMALALVERDEVTVALVP